MCGELGGGVGGELFGSLVLLALPACNVRDCFPLLSSCSSQTSIHHRPETCEKFEAFRLGRSSGIHFVQRSVVSPFVGCCIVRCVRSLDFVPPRAALFFCRQDRPCSAMEPTIHCPRKLQPNYRCCLLAVLIARPPASFRHAGGQILVFAEVESGRNPARNSNFRPGRTSA